MEHQLYRSSILFRGEDARRKTKALSSNLRPSRSYLGQTIDTNIRRSRFQLENRSSRRFQQEVAVWPDLGPLRRSKNRLSSTKKNRCFQKSITTFTLCFFYICLTALTFRSKFNQAATFSLVILYNFA